MSAPSSRCPEPEVIAAFVAGNLFAAELKMTAEHLRKCEDCREVAAEAAWEERRVAQPSSASRPQRTWPWWLGVAAAALAGVLLTLWYARSDVDGNEAIRPLIAAVPRDRRWLEPRVTGGFPWAPLSDVRRGANDTPDAAQMKLIGAAGEVLQRTAGREDLEALHVTAVAHLLSGHPKNAVDLLAPIAPSAASAQIWNDLAAARYAMALSADDPAQFADALAAADAALRVNPKLPEALFNRALSIERLGPREQARVAWERYLAVDGGSAWGAEARAHVRALRPHASFRDELQRRYELLGRDPEAAQAMARQYPQDVRVWTETEILARWAEAFQRGDVAEAAKHLRIALAFAEELARHEERMLLRIVETIAKADAAQRAVLADAHVRFRAARLTYGASQPAAAEPMFAAAAAGFARGRSPMALLASYFEANTIFDQGRLPEARAALLELVAAVPDDFAACGAQIRWQLGLAHSSLGQWGEAIGTLAESVASFERLGESGFANAARDILAEAYDRIGDRRAAWDLRIVSLRELGSTNNPRLRVALNAAARSAAVNRDWPVSVSILGLLIDTTTPQRDLVYVESHLSRARLYARLGENKAAMADLAEATEAIQQLDDAAIRDRADADRMIVEAFLAPSPNEALPLLSRAIEFHQARGRHMHLPDLFLQRGRAYAAIGNAKFAADDFETGIREVEKQRASVTTPGEAWSNFAVAEELFDEAVALAMTRGDAAAAFAYAERSRSRESESQAALPFVARHAPDTAVIEYASLPTRLVIFVVDERGVRGVQVPFGREALAAEVDLLTRSAIEQDDVRFRRAAAAMYQRLLEPVANDIAARRTLVFVPDATLDTVPFSALLDPRGHYVVEQHAVVVAPSSALFLQLACRERPSRDMHLLLVKGAVARDGEMSRLLGVESEAAAIVEEYGAGTVVVSGANGPDFEKRAVGADVIHFAGHAESPDGTSEAALVTARSGAGRLDAREIAAMKLSRTRMVVLAGCGTAQGRQRPGETSISVARAFLAAGVSSVAATLWPIEDGPAAEFFPVFHRHLLRGNSPAEALRATQIEWIRRSHAPLGMWAAVQILGS